MIGIGTRRNSATTANQSASAPTIAASAIAFTPLTQKLGGKNSVTTKVAAAISSKESANILARLSSMSLFITLRIEPDGRIAQKSPLLRQLGSLMLAHAIEQSRQGENDDNARYDG
ncbi:hypothetical protein MY010_12790 [Escherichia coli]|nr:hypothetical protein TUM2798_30770 [Escherichia coli]GDU75130.1 hypothetical protein ExPUPEC79_00391 [Escherichia coli]GHM12946.1 hypothetical protein ECZU42_21650 [Escherichia coli]GHM37550.1 hypothetical protein ECZU47_09720 [Escherichia coli]GHO10012.1 hypothetical protein MY010_12790 [Escherichia coli]